MWKQTSRREVKNSEPIASVRALTSTRQSLTKKRSFYKERQIRAEKNENLASRMVPELCCNVRFALLRKA